MVVSGAAALSESLAIELRTPLRLKTRGGFVQTIEVAALVRAICWRLSALSVFHGRAPWEVDHRPLVERARGVTVVEQQVRSDDLLRTSMRGGTPHTMPQGGLGGSAVLRGVPADVRDARGRQPGARRQGGGYEVRGRRRLQIADCRLWTARGWFVGREEGQPRTAAAREVQQPKVEAAGLVPAAAPLRKRR